LGPIHKNPVNTDPPGHPATLLPAHTQDQLDAIAHKLNTRARRARNYATPAEALNELLVATTT